MSLAFMGWMFTIGVLLHNAEEAMFLPSWSTRAGKWYPPVSAVAFRVAVGVLSAIFIAITVASSLSPARSIGAYLMAGYVLAMVLNVFLPHVSAPIFTRKYMPGTATGLFLNLPLGALYLQQAFSTKRVVLPTFYWAGPLVVLAVLALVPALLGLGRCVQNATR